MKIIREKTFVKDRNMMIEMICSFKYKKYFFSQTKKKINVDLIISQILINTY